MAQRVSLHDPDEAVYHLERDGGVILTDFASVSEVERVNLDAAPYIDAISDERVSKGEHRGTVRCYKLFGRSHTAREIWLQQPDFLKIIRHFLQTSSVPYNSLDGSDQIMTDPILSVAATMEISPGEKAQRLHRDDFIWQQTHHHSQHVCVGGECKEQARYRIGSDVSLGLIVPGVETTAENGATMFVKGSHLWDHAQHPRPEDVAYAEMKLGEAFVFLGSTVHGGGENRTTASRTVHGFFYCRSYLRPEENQFLWWTKDEVEKWSVEAQKQAGYLLGNPFLGHSNEKQPVQDFRTANGDVKA